MMIDTSRRTTEPRWLIWAREMLAFAQTGLAFTRDQYNRQRYERPLALAAQDHGRATPAWRAVQYIELVHRVGGRAREAANYRSGTSSRTDLTLAARQLAQDIPQVVRHLLTLLRREGLCELLDRAAPKRLDLRHQPGELVLILRLFGIGHTLNLATDGACSNPAIASIFRAETLPPISTDRREGARCKVAVAS